MVISSIRILARVTAVKITSADAPAMCSDAIATCPGIPQTRMVVASVSAMPNPASLAIAANPTMVEKC